MIFHDAETIVRDFLASAVEPVKVHTLVPARRPETFVRVTRTGGAAINRVLEVPQITIQAWATDPVTASELARECRQALLDGASQMPLVRGAEEIGGPYFDPDPDTNLPRYTFTVALTIRAAR